jgi:hypothetical protein
MQAHERAARIVRLAALPGTVEAALERPQVAHLGTDIRHAIRATVRMLYRKLTLDYQAAGKPYGADGRGPWISEPAGVGRPWN